jgi:hypothetical protein
VCQSRPQFYTRPLDRKDLVNFAQVRKQIEEAANELTVSEVRTSGSPVALASNIQTHTAFHSARACIGGSAFSLIRSTNVS